MKTYTLSLLSLLFLFAISASVATAATTPTLTPTTTTAEESDSESSNTEELKDIIKNVQVKGLTTDNKRGFIGIVKRVSEEAITVETRKGTEIITLSEDVSVVQDGKAFKVSNIEIDSQLAIMGYQDGEDFLPKRILVLKKKLQTNSKTIHIGSVKKMEKTGTTSTAFTIQTRTGEEKTFSLTPASKPVIEDNKGATLKSTDIETDQEVILITIPEESTSQAVKESSGKIVRIRSLVANDAETEEEDEPTPTSSKSKVTPTVSPKASPTKKPTATP